MRVPIVMLSGNAGVGKDTVAQFLVKNHGAVTIAQADPMKRLAMKLFGFSEETLWGPSENRKTIAQYHQWDDRFVGDWLEEVLPLQSLSSWGPLKEWFQGIARLLNPTARVILQTLGTEWGRAFSRDMWVDLALTTAKKLLGGGYFYSRVGGLEGSANFAPPNMVVVTDGRFRNELLAVRSAGGATVKIVSPGSGLQGEAAKHSSETEQDGIPESWFDAVLTNDKAHGLESLEKLVGWMITKVLMLDPVHLETIKETDVYRYSWQGIL